MTTASDLITDSMYTAGIWAVGEVSPAIEMQDAFKKLNQLLYQLDTQKLTIFHTLDFTGNFVPNQFSYTIGPGGDFNTIRPVRIQNLYFILSNVSYYVKQITNNQYDSIALKQLATQFPEVFYYETSYPLGKLWFYPVPTTNSQVVVSYDDQLTQFTSLSDDVTFPPGYELLITLELAQILCPRYGKQFPIELKTQLVHARNFIKATNHTPLYLKNDPLLINRNRSDYSWINLSLAA